MQIPLQLTACDPREECNILAGLRGVGAWSGPVGALCSGCPRHWPMMPSANACPAGSPHIWKALPPAVVGVLLPLSAPLVVPCPLLQAAPACTSFLL